VRVLILGGYGVFGGRLVELLADLASLEIIVGGRDLEKAKLFCASHAGKFRLSPVRVSRSEISDALDAYKPDLLVDGSGPFQDYGKDPYNVVRACIAAKVSYLDFADGADFVFGISQFDEDAKKAGVFVLTGVSSFPVLPSAVLSRFAEDMELTSVAGGIAPSPHAGIGLNVMRAVVGYAGGPVELLRDGKKTYAIGLAESRRFTVAVPGRLPLRNLRFSLVDVPDLRVIPPNYETMTDIWMGAGPVPESLHRILNGLAKARALFRLPSMEPLSPLFYWVLNTLKFGENRGGMFVHAQGVSNGKSITKTWHLLAEGDDGPYIPSMAIEAIIRKSLSGVNPANGARPATDALKLEDYDEVFENRAIFTGMRSSSDKEGALWQQTLGDAFRALPPTLQALHKAQSETVWRGEADVVRGKRLMARMVATLFGLPSEADKIPVSVRFMPHGNGERWQRAFGDQRFESFLNVGTGRDTYLVTEKFGMMTISLALVFKDEKLYFVPRRWKILGLPLPHFLLPEGTSFEEEREGIFHFDVKFKAPIVGLIAAYRGWLKPSR